MSGFGDNWQGGMGPQGGGLGLNRQNMNPAELAELGIQLAVAALQQTKQNQQSQPPQRMMSQEPPMMPQYGDIAPDRYGFNRAGGGGGGGGNRGPMMNQSFGNQEPMMNQNFGDNRGPMMDQSFGGNGGPMMNQSFGGNGGPMMNQSFGNEQFGGMQSMQQNYNVPPSGPDPPALMSIRTSELRAPDMSSTSVTKKKNLCHKFRDTGSCPKGTSCEYSHGVFDVSSGQSHSGVKKNLCHKFRDTGSCPKGTNCEYSHVRNLPSGQSVSAKHNDLYKTTICKKFQESGSCPKGIHCNFAHGIADLRTKDVGSLYKTSLCHKFQQTGECPNGLDCRHAHGRFELRPKSGASSAATEDLRNTLGKKNKVKLRDVPEMFKTSLCRKFMEEDSCQNGSECQWAHGTAELRPKPSTSSSGSSKGDISVSAVPLDKFKTALCQKFEKTGNCPNGKGCNYAHGKADLRGKGASKPLSQLDNDQYKTVLCARYRDTGSCQYGDACGFAHGTIELRAPKTPKAGSKRPAESSTSSTPAKKKASVEKKTATPKAEETTEDKSTEGEVETEKEPYADIPSSLLKCHVCDGLGQKVEDRTPAEFADHLETQSHLNLLEFLSAEMTKEAEVIRCWAKRQETIKKINTPGSTTTECKMCEIKDACGSLRAHRNSEPHLKLKKFLHPFCEFCKQSFDLRLDWVKHRLEEKHLAQLHNKGITEIDINNGNPVEPSASKKPEDDEFDQELKDAEEKQLNDDDFIMEYVVPEKEDEIPLGFSMVKPVNGHFCCVCGKFFLEKMSDHCKSDNHYDKFVDIIRTKKEKIADKRAAIKEQVEESSANDDS